LMMLLLERPKGRSKERCLRCEKREKGEKGEKREKININSILNGL